MNETKYNIGDYVKIIMGPVNMRLGVGTVIRIKGSYIIVRMKERQMLHDDFYALPKELERITSNEFFLECI